MTGESITPLGVPGSFTDYSSYMNQYMNPYMMQYMNPYMMMNQYLDSTYMSDPAQYYINFKKKMAEAEHEMEASKLNHAVDMHAAKQQADVQNLSIHDKAFFEKAMLDNGIETSIKNLAIAIRDKDQDAICEEFDKIQNILITKYSYYFKTANGGKNISQKVVEHIEELFQLKTGVDLRSALEANRESALEHGINKYSGLLSDGRDYHKKYSDITINYMFGTRIDNKRGKDREEKLGCWIGRGIQLGKAGVAGGGLGLLAGGTLVGIGKFFGIGKDIFRLPGETEVKDKAGNIMKDAAGNPIMKKVKAGKFWRGLKFGGKAGLLLGLLGDAFWQFSNS